MKIFEQINDMIFWNTKKEETSIVIDSFNPLLNILSWNYTVSRDNYWKYYNSNPFVYSSVNLISNSVVKLDYWVFNNWVKTKEKNLDLLNNTLLNDIVSTLVMYWDVYIRKEGVGRRITKLTVLDSSKIRTDWNYIIYNTWNKQLKYAVEEFIIIKWYTNGQNTWIGAIEAWIKNILTIEEIDRWNLTFLKNGWTTGGKFKIGKKLTKEEREAFKQAFQSQVSGASNAWSNIILWEGEEYEMFQKTLKDMDFTSLKINAIEELLACFGINKGILGKENSLNYATLEAYRDIFIENTIIPITIRLQDSFNESCIFENEFKFINIKNEPFDNIITLYSNWVITLNEARGMVWLDPVQGWDTIINANWIEVKKIVDSIENKKNETNNWLKQDFISFKDELDKIVKDSWELFWTENYFENQVLEFDKLIDSKESNIKKWLKSFMEIQKKDIDAILKDEEDPNNISKKIKDLFKKNKNKYTKLLGVSIADSLMKSFELWSNQAYKEFKDSWIEWFIQIGDPEMSKMLNKQIKKLSETINETTAEQLINEIDKEQNKWLWVAEIVVLISNKFKDFDKNRLEMIVRTELIKAGNSAKNKVYEDNIDIVDWKVWYTAKDERVCKECWPMNGKVIALDKNFFNVGDETGEWRKISYEEVSFPPLHPRCRCVIYPKLRD